VAQLVVKLLEFSSFSTPLSKIRRTITPLRITLMLQAAASFPATLTATATARSESLGTEASDSEFARCDTTSKPMGVSWSRMSRSLLSRLVGL
jgi:hypothetical protein